MVAATARAQSRQLDKLLSDTYTRPAPVRPPARATRKPLGYALRQWASSQVAAYRVGLVLGYLAMMFFGTSSIVAGIPTFVFTTPEGWTPIWGTAVVLGGFIGGIGSLRAGAEPVTREVRIYNRVELTGSILLFLTLGTYSALLLIIGYGYGDSGRAAIGAGFVALGVPASVRMVWLIFRPRFLALKKSLHVIPTAPAGYVLLPIDENGLVIPETNEQTAARLGLKGA